MATRTQPLPRADDAHALAALRRELVDAGFTGENVKALLRSEGELLSRPRDLPVQRRRLGADGSPLASLVALFVLGLPVDATAVDTRLLSELDLVDHVDGRVRATVRLLPHEELVIASDRADERSTPDHVAGVHRPSVTLAQLTIRRPVVRALDLGTGNGVQALLLSRHAEHVVATDVNERALAFAAFNCALNDATNVELRAGSFFEPLAGETFDLIVTNPPYVVSPESEFVFRDGGLRGDDVSAGVLRELPVHLADGGHATLMLSWIGEGVERPRAWLDGSGCDAWILHTGSEDPLSTAAAWNLDVGDPDELDARIGRWLAYYRDLGIDALSYGCLVLRRRAGTNWTRALELPRNGIASGAGEQLERMFTAVDLIDQGAGLLDLRLRFADGARIDEELAPTGDGWRPSSVSLALRDGLGFSAGLDTLSARVVAGIAPARTLRECLERVADETGTARDELLTAGTELVKRLLELGYLEPARENLETE